MDLACTIGLGRVKDGDRAMFPILQLPYLSGEPIGLGPTFLDGASFDCYMNYAQMHMCHWIGGGDTPSPPPLARPRHSL